MDLAIGHSLTTHERMDLDEWLATARHAEDSGLTAVTFADVLTRNFEMTVGLTLLATATSRVRIIASVTNPVSRHPAVTAAAFASLQKISGGRMVLGVSTGDSALHNIGRGPARLAEVRDFVTAFRDLLATGEATFRGAPCRVPWAPEVIDRPVPVFLAARGPRSLALAGEIADGVLTGQGFGEAAITQTLSKVEAGAAGAGRSLDDLEIWFHGPVSIREDRAQAVDDVIDEVVGVSRIPGISPFDGDPTAGEELHEAHRELKRRYDASSHAAVGNEGRVLARKLGLTDALIERMAIVGDEDEVARRLREIEALGVRRLFVTGLVPEPRDLISRLARIVPR